MITSHNIKGLRQDSVPAGVNGMKPPEEIYKPSKHNPGLPMRPGANDAFQHPSLDFTGIRIPYWALSK